MRPSSPKRASFLSGVSILTLSALVVKVIGLLYRIPMLNLLGTEGMGYFNTAYEVYALFCSLSTAGLPVAMSVLISGLEAEGRGRDGQRVFRQALLLAVPVGCVGMGVMWGFSTQLADLLGNSPAATSMKAIAPTVLLICLSSAFRGYFQGKRQMLPTALSQVVEAAGKLFLGVAFAGYALSCGETLPVAAAYAVMGLTVGTALSVLYLLCHKALARPGAETTTVGEGGRTNSSAATPTMTALLATAVPVTLSTGIISLTKCLDLVLILRRLQDGGYSAAYANSVYGCYSTLVVPVFNVLPSLTTSVAMSAIPALSAALKRGREGEADLKRTAASSLGLTLAVSIPAALGLSVFAGDILTLLFRGQPDAVAMATPWLSCLGLAVPASCLITVTGGMLQAAGKANRPMISMLIGVTAKALAAYLLLGREGLGMAAIPISSLLCDTLVVAVNLIFIARHAPAMLPRPQTALGLVGVPTLLGTLAVTAVKLWRPLWGMREGSPLMTLATVVATAALYGGGTALCLLLGKRLSINKLSINKREESLTRP